jgi:hypothetical protein
MYIFFDFLSIFYGGMGELDNFGGAFLQHQTCLVLIPIEPMTIFSKWKLLIHFSCIS